MVSTSTASRDMYHFLPPLQSQEQATRARSLPVLGNGAGAGAAAGTPQAGVRDSRLQVAPGALVDCALHA